MLRIPCPKCKDISYTSDVESFKPCPVCGFIFSGKYGPDRRTELRVEREVPFIFSFRGQDFKANTIDFSEKGIGIKIHGKTSVTIGDVLSFTVEDRKITAKVTWVKRVNDNSLAGLSRLN
ncbi:MAG: PilZ domain-containing protein [Thermodesulfovibrionales bacterium]